MRRITGPINHHAARTDKLLKRMPKSIVHSSMIEHMKIDRIELREVRMKMKYAFETSFGIEEIKRALLVTVHAGGLWGIGEVSCGEAPGYNHEATDTAWVVLREFIVPQVIGKEYASPADFQPLSKKVRGNYFTKGALEMALWDLFAKAANQPLWTYLGGTKTELPVGLSVGIKKNPEELADFVRTQAALGYRRIKLKIAPGRDVDFVRAAREALGPNTALTVDANSAYDLGNPDHVARLHALDAFGLEYIEQPLHYEDIVDHAQIAQQLKTPICLDEPIHSMDDVRKAHQLGSGKVINLKLGRVTGFTESKKVAEFCGTHGMGLWCGGMMESGVGRAHNVALQTLPQFTSASDTAPSARYWDEDIIEPEIVMDASGFTHPLPGVGIGVTLKHDLIDKLTVHSEVHR
jgi:O-succinylbenzoate synthase